MIDGREGDGEARDIKDRRAWSLFVEVGEKDNVMTAWVSTE